jgi:hypothetical protein
VSGGAAAASGRVEEGDSLEAVDGVDVRGFSLKKLATEMVLLFCLQSPLYIYIPLYVYSLSILCMHYVYIGLQPIES